MSSTLYRQIGPFTIERPIGHGGMASVFLARDTRNGAVAALKVVHVSSDEEAQEVLQSEQRGAELQQRFASMSRFVPKVYDSGFASDYFYISMEYIEGEDLSQAIHRGPLPWKRAVAITSQLCEFLEEADRFETDASSRRVLLHNDLKPRNIRLVPGDGIKVLDFGAAKSLSLSRKVTRNDFGSTAYLSPECLESGDRDLHSDAWALGVLLYEMIRGRQPFRADDTRRLEQLIRSKRPPETIGGDCPEALEAVVTKLLAPEPSDRYYSPADIRADLARADAGEPTVALQEGWLTKVHDEPPTRRTRREPEGDEPPTRRTNPAIPVAPVPVVAAAEPAVRPRRRFRRTLARALVVLAIVMAVNESCVSSKASRLANTVPLHDFAGLAAVWPRYESLRSSSFLGGAGTNRLRAALVSQTMVLAERVMSNYRTPVPTVRETQWKAAREALARAVAVAPGERSLRAALQYCDGHLLRINGEAHKARGRTDSAQRDFTGAIVAFREAAAIRSNWPDPFLGLARTFIYGLEDVDRGADALKQAEKLGHHPGERETTQLADGYRARAESFSRTAQTLKGMPQERDYLSRASDAFREALTRYGTVAGFANVAQSLRDTQRRLDRVEERLAELSKFEGGWTWE
ncbi:MAG: serine/threonine protein kinase [Acidobacteria bacterium]|nr:serine/threonine protein kinase [Acidobacteriota bacterium]